MTIESAIKIAGTPNAKGKQSSIPRHGMSSLKIGVTKVEMNAPRLMEK